MSNQFLPTITIPASDRRRLEHLARAAAKEGDADAICLLDELDRAEVVPDRSAQLDSIVTMGSWVTFWTNWHFPRETMQLVYPQDYASEETQIPVLSPLGVALIGLKAGRQMPFRAAGCTHIVRVERVSRTESNVIPMLFRAPVHRDEEPLDDDPGPTAA